MDSNYAWIITRDVLFEGGGISGTSDKGTIGPRNAPAAMITRLRAAGVRGGGCPEARAFRILDDDGEIYYHGLIIGPEGEETDFGPLEDFGQPNAGATDIQYKNAAGEWETL